MRIGRILSLSVLLVATVAIPVVRAGADQPAPAPLPADPAPLAAAATSVSPTPTAPTPTAPTASAPTPDTPPPVAGGSNYDFYYLNGCYREPYNVISGFSRAPDMIRLQLGQMRAAGQDRLTIGVFHHHGDGGGAVMDSTGGTLSPADLKNFTDLLAGVRTAGFAEVTVAFNSQNPNNPSGWRGWQQDLYDENWQLVQKVHDLVVAAKIPYRIDLGNELTPSTGQSVVVRYDQQLWQDYTAKYGRTDTVGFSVNSNDPGQIPNVAKVYGDNPPPVFDLHIYGDEYNQLVGDDQQLRRQGYVDQPVIIGESFYNDTVAADGFLKGSKDSGRRILYLTQWPKTRDNAPQCDQVDVAPPLDFSAYRAAGF
ncbi:hypothetical protein [Kutzneria sp. 744]|uniref:hypothetical protein n=1 Tax=Kutzneria sp. (strain 744) TaxID=345341 RepID=UPI0003EED61F|nr:hypothetical protein [Kutzneria sp. 744]EWM11292.1 serine/arginine repetitive matrix protein 2 [Kutzneria sp. 744]